ncbi:MAG: D-lyxose/D-mannose family sugar isomerase [Victivallales bacterium]|nr:D-lyxose/D-mannose family sugar isomerase [Victivallales bacterium]
MKRSQINSSIETAMKVFKKLGLNLPPFAFWTVEDWKNKGSEVDEIRKAGLGWDVTDFGQGNFELIGRTLFTLRNAYKQDGNHSKVYAEKFILDPPRQHAPLHFHRSKMEDIVNRAGGNILITLYKATTEGKCSDEKFTVQIDGQTCELEPGTVIQLKPGQSVCLAPYIIHSFCGEEGTGIDMNGVQYTVSGEVSSVCDDWNDNCFLDPVERFPAIEEDEPRKYYLCNEYPKATL